MRTLRPGRGKKSTVAPAVSWLKNIPVPGSPDSPPPNKKTRNVGKITILKTNSLDDFPKFNLEDFLLSDLHFPGV